MAGRRKGLRRRVCPICGLYRGRKPHTGAIHERIRAARRAIGRRGR